MRVVFNARWGLAPTAIVITNYELSITNCQSSDLTLLSWERVRKFNQIL